MAFSSVGLQLERMPIYSKVSATHFNGIYTQGNATGLLPDSLSIPPNLKGIYLQASKLGSTWWVFFSLSPVPQFQIALGWTEVLNTKKIPTEPQSDQQNKRLAF